MARVRLTRRQMLAGLAATTASMAEAGAPTRSLRPAPRGEGTVKVAAAPADALIRRSGLNGDVAYVVLNAETGETLEEYNPTLPLPPASTAKALTSLYAMDALGLEYRFETKLLATGEIRDGRIEGDLILAGGGDPVLDTDGLMEMAKALKAAGIREVGGYLRVWTDALPNLYQIDDKQPDYVGYNPAICGLNLNFNRVRFGWERQGTDYLVNMDARSGRYQPGVEMARMEIVDRSTPVYTYDGVAGIDAWTVARRALGASGARWLPVRRPGLYAGEVFQVLVRSQGIVCNGAVKTADTLAGKVLHTRQSESLAPILKDMLKYSNNMTAEVVGLSASQKVGEPVASLPESASRMNDWLAREMSLTGIALEDHSGLGDDSRVTAMGMARAMQASGLDGPLRPLLKDFRLEETTFSVAAKTGTLNFVSALTGFVTGPKGTPLAFAILCADLPRRDALTVAEREKPKGGSRWNGAAKWLQRALIDRWGKSHLL